MTDRNRRSATRIAGVVAVLAFIVAWSVDLPLWTDYEPGRLLTDFRANVWEPGRDLLAGRDPLRVYTEDSAEGSVYPPASVLTTLPFALLPYRFAATLWLFVLIASVVLALRLCGVREWTCVALALWSPPVLTGVLFGNVSLLLVLVLAAAWIWRDRPWHVGVLLGIAIAGRLFLWPLVFWLFFTRRRIAAAATVVAAGVATLLGWMAVAFERVGDFPAITRRNASQFDQDGSGVASLAANLGASVETGTALALLAGAAALAVAFRQEDDLATFSWAIAAALLASPIAWTHYLAILLVPLALSTPTMSRAWLLPYLTLPHVLSPATLGARLLNVVTGIVFVLAVAARTSRRHLVRESTCCHDTTRQAEAPAGCRDRSRQP